MSRRSGALDASMKPNQLHAAAAARLIRLGLPGPQMSTLLRACLFSGEAGRDAWDTASPRLSDLVTGLRRDLHRARTLVPLLAAAQVRNDVALDAATQTVFRTAWVREELRMNVFHGILQEVLCSLDGADVSVVLLGGAAHGATVYRGMGLRHTHGIDLLLRPRDVERATAVLESAGFERSPEQATDTGVCLLHETGVPVTLCRGTLAPISDLDAPEVVWGRTRTCSVGDRSVAVLHAADALLHVCARALDARYPDGLLWVCDAWLIIDRHPELDWDDFVGVAAEARIGLIVWLVLGHLVPLKARVPGRVLEALETLVPRTNSRVLDLALYWTRERLGLRALIRHCESWRDRSWLIARVLFPSEEYMRSGRPGGARVLLLGSYAVRILQFVADQARGTVSQRRRIHGTGTADISALPRMGGGLPAARASGSRNR